MIFADGVRIIKKLHPTHCCCCCCY